MKEYYTWTHELIYITFSIIKHIHFIHLMVTLEILCGIFISSKTVAFKVLHNSWLISLWYHRKKLL